ncbi:kinetochore protein NDC80 homolog [Papaver somniferum]|uniref:kinetochore protein NDC80 homolog n=1 Tax=Papaver somniferum TaxID=3469 RepID=UPI000E6F854C|nr:kinetochore protein NDC80 homolog [Papaver somniferum]
MMRGTGRGGRGGGGRRPKIEPAPPPPQQQHRPSIISYNTNPRDSDASFSSINNGNHRRTGSSTGGRNYDLPINDKRFQNQALKRINAYLLSHSTSIYLKPPLPSAKDITDCIRFLFLRLSYTDSASDLTVKIDEDLPILLDFMSCPFKITKSALKAPGTPHSWPNLCAVIHWLVEICVYSDHVNSSNSTSTSTGMRCNKLLDYALRSYEHFIAGDDDLVDQLDNEFREKLELERGSVENTVKELQDEIVSLERKIEGLRSKPSARDALEKEKAMLEDDVKKFNVIINGLSSGIETLENGIKEKEKELEAKYVEHRRICEENEELKKTIDAQTVNMRDADRMKRELHAVERDIAEAEEAKNMWEEKSWDLDSKISYTFKELVNLSIECNQAIRRLKLENEFQYVLNPKGSTPADVMGIDYKTLKVALTALTDDIKKNSVAKLEEQISLQQQWTENSMKLEAKRILLAELQSKIDALESQLSMMKKETEEFTMKCNMEGKRMIEDFERETHNVEIMEKEAEEYVKLSNLKLEETIKQQEEEIQACARELLALVDSVSKYKESMESIISEMKTGLSETAEAVETSFRGSLPANFDTFSDLVNLQ